MCCWPGPACAAASSSAPQSRLSGNQTQHTGEPARGPAFWSAGEIPAGDWQALSLDFTGELAADGESPLVPDQPNNMILTSGSSGTPRRWSTASPTTWPRPGVPPPLIPGRSLRLAALLPLFHVGGYAILFRVFLAGAAALLDDRTRPSRRGSRISPSPTSRWCRPSSGACWHRGSTHPAPGCESCCSGRRHPGAPGQPADRPGAGAQGELWPLRRWAARSAPGNPAAGVVGRPLPGREVCIRQGRSACAVRPCLPATSGRASWCAPR